MKQKIELMNNGTCTIIGDMSHLHESAMPKDPQTQQSCKDLFIRCNSLVLATVDASGQPHASYAPFVQDENNATYIFVSGLARHTRNILTTGRVSCMLIEDEADASMSFARVRLTFDATAVPIERSASNWDEVLERFQSRFGKLIATLRTLGDFTLIRLDFDQAVLVKGFGQAYTVSTPDFAEIDHLRTGI